MSLDQRRTMVAQVIEAEPGISAKVVCAVLGVREHPRVSCLIDRTAL